MFGYTICVFLFMATTFRIKYSFCSLSDRRCELNEAAKTLACYSFFFLRMIPPFCSITVDICAKSNCCINHFLHHQYFRQHCMEDVAITFRPFYTSVISVSSTSMFSSYCILISWMPIVCRWFVY